MKPRQTSPSSLAVRTALALTAAVAVQAAFADHGRRQTDIVEELSRLAVTKSKAAERSSDAAAVLAALNARHGDPASAQHREDHGGLDAISMQYLEATAKPEAGLNQARKKPFLLAQAQVALTVGTADQIGQWSAIINTPVIPIFAALLPNGKVLMWDSVGDAPTESFPVHDFTRAAIWDPITNTGTRIDVSGYNIFCAGFNHLADGRVFVAGGNKDSALNGIRQTHFFNSTTNTWSRGPDMAFERWYPSVASLPNGEQFVMAGGPDTHEVWQTNNSMRTLSSAVLPHARDYPFIQTGPDGRVIYAGPQQNMRLLSTAGTGAWQELGNRDGLYRGYASYAVYDIGKILITGGSSSTNTTTIISAVGSGLSVSPAANMLYGRRQHNATVLPDGTVLVTGGLSSGAGLVDLNAPVFAAEVWNPSTGAWRELASAAVTRQYHSVALLLPDGRVLTGGGGICGICQQVGYLRKDIEVFSPPYLFNKDGSGTLAPRPVISAAPASLGYAQGFTISTPDAASITKASLVRLGAPTHGQDQGQRFVPLNFTVGAGALNATSPGNANIAPPGYYMLFLVNADGVPSVASMVQVAGSAPPPPADTPFASTLVARHSAKCMDVPSSSTRSGVQLQQYTCNGSSAQLFDFTPVVGKPSTYTIRNRNSRLCVHVRGGSASDGARIEQRSCSSVTHQQFALNPVPSAGAKAYQVKPVHSGKCADVNGASTANGAKLIQWSCHGGDNQIWTISARP